ncbi:MAG: CPBP family intramembrane metalloprotease [Bacteroidales bacterium]|nr:CPBP family intramembrane metalloprotease [Bacteroidales bacterium]
MTHLLKNNSLDRAYCPGWMLILFFVLTFIISWSILIPALFFVPEDGQIFFIILAAFGPFISAITVIRGSSGRTGLRQWLRGMFSLRIPVVLYLAGVFFFPVGIGLLHYFLYIFFGGEPDFSDAKPWYLYLAYLLPTALLTGGNEEPGWRGFALPALLERFHPVVSSLILGVIHALWHLPLMVHYDTTMGWYLFNLIPLTFIFNWFYIKSRYAVIPVMLMHAGVNTIGSFLPTPVDVLGGLGTYMFLRGAVYWIIAVILIIVTKGRLGYESPASKYPIVD